MGISCATNSATMVSMWPSAQDALNLQTQSTWRTFLAHIYQKKSRRLWRSPRRKSRSVPEGGAIFPETLSFRERHGGVEKRGGWKTLTNDTPPKKGFWTPPQVSVLCFSCTKIFNRAARSSFGGVQKFSGERVLWYVFLPPSVLHPPYHGPVLSQKITKAWHEQIFHDPRKSGT